MIPLRFSTCWQVNLNRHFGGGEVFTAALARAATAVGLRSVVVVDARADFWPTLDLGNTEIVAVRDAGALDTLPLGAGDVTVVQSGLPGDRILALKGKAGAVIGYAHLPYHERSPKHLQPFDRVCPVSAYVQATLRAHGLPNVHDEPCLGIADLNRGGAAHAPLCRQSEFAWDVRKFRERVFSWLEPLYLRLRPETRYVKPAGLTLGIVSRIATIKQFPEMFSILAPIIAEFPDVHVAIFGNGAYASIRDFKRALRPLGDRARFWGQQTDVRSCYQQVDWVLSGLPEKEAMGLNIIEAQRVGVPVLAVDAPPFSETVSHGVTGLRYTDPRRDQGRHFRDMLASILRGDAHLDRTSADEHLARFSEPAFAQRFARLLASL